MHAECIAISDRLLQEATTLRRCLLDISWLHPSDIPSQRLLRGNPDTARRLDSLEHVSIGLSNVLDLLRASQDCLSLRIREIKSSLIPINVLPIEVMLQIFTNCITATDDSDTIVATVMVLTEVCARWREIAIHHSSLWTLLDCSWPENLIALWTTRAGPHRALDVLIRRPVDLQYVTHDICSLKWGSLHCGFDITHGYPHFALLKERVRGLKMLNNSPLFTSFGQKRPNLESLQEMQGSIGGRSNYARLGDQLVDLSVRLSDDQQLEVMFRSCVRLERLCICMREPKGLLENRTIVFPQTLENLIIGYASEDVLKRLLKVISAPNLKIFSIHHSLKGCFSDKDIMESFFARCPKISKLSVFGPQRFVSGVIFALSKTSIVLPLSLPGPASGIVQAQFLLPDLRALEICLDSVLGTPAHTVYELIGEELRGFLRARRGESDGMWMDEGRWKDQTPYLPSVGIDQPNSNGLYSRRAVALESLCIAGPIDEEHREWLMKRVGTLLVMPLGSEEAWMPF